MTKLESFTNTLLSVHIARADAELYLLTAPKIQKFEFCSLKPRYSPCNLPKIEDVDREGFLFFFFLRVPFSSRSARENLMFFGSVAALSPDSSVSSQLTAERSIFESRIKHAKIFSVFPHTREYRAIKGVLVTSSY